MCASPDGTDSPSDAMRNSLGTAPGAVGGPPSMSMSPGGMARPSSSDAGSAEISNTLSPATATEPPSYPPTEVKRWLTCPVFWRLSKRWEPRVELWTPHRLVGTAIHSGIAVLLDRIKDPPSSRVTNFTGESPEAFALGVLGEGYVEQETWGLPGLAKLVERGVTLLSQEIQTRLLPGATIIAVEYVGVTNPGPQGIIRIVDLILERAGTLEIWDWKTALNLDEKYIPEKGREVLHSWQLLDYAYHVEQWFGKPVRVAGHGLVALGPGKPRVHFLPMTLTAERLEQWRRDAERIWHLMWCQSDGGPEYHNWMACTDRHLHFGRECVFMAACYDLHDDERVFGGIYRMRETK